MTAYGAVKVGPFDFIWCCRVCSALIIDQEKHDQWHGDRLINVDTFSKDAP